MTAQSGQAGYLSLAVLLILLGGSSLWIAEVSGSRQLATPLARHGDVQRSLLAARQALLSYAASYATLYGPAGAGPGHLPCPDTDNASQRRSAADFRRDGPDPPCGSGLVASGNLPRHINLPGHRFAFHSMPDQHIQYKVATAFVNNPVNREVNPGVLQRTQQPWKFAMELSLPQAVSADMPTPKVVVTRNALLDAVVPAVAAWFIDRAGPVANGRCVSSDSAAFIVSLVADNTQTGDNCSLTDQTLMIEQLEASRHWFVRNRWHEWLQVTSDSRCIDAPVDACQWKYHPPVLGRDQLDAKPWLVWEPEL